jgi:hypothetical protein
MFVGCREVSPKYLMEWTVSVAEIMESFLLAKEMAPY